MTTFGYRAKVLSPVHVGSGQVLSCGFEVVHDADRSIILDVEAAMRAYPDFFARSDAGLPSPEKLLAHLEARGDRQWMREVRPRIQAREVRVQMRDGRGALLIPGSSWKGALRTAILRAVVRRSRGVVGQAVNALRNPDNKAAPAFAARGIERELRGNRDRPHFDLLRALSVTDAAFDPDSLQVAQVRVRSPAAGQKTREKEYWLACEVIAPGATSQLRLGLDGFLLSHRHRQKLGLPHVDLDPTSLARVCREHALALLETEQAYFEMRSPLKEAHDFLKALKSEIEHAPTDTLFLRLGYGIGWCGTTGELANPKERLDVLQLFEERGCQIGRLPASAYDDEDNVFPKTRRYVVATSSPLFGWVRLDRDDQHKVPWVRPSPIRLP